MLYINSMFDIKKRVDARAQANCESTTFMDYHAAVTWP